MRKSETQYVFFYTAFQHAQRLCLGHFLIWKLKSLCISNMEVSGLVLGLVLDQLFVLGLVPALSWFEVSAGE